MCNITDNFMEDLIFDLEYQEYLYQRKQEQNHMLDEMFSIEEEAYNIMAEQYFTDLQTIKNK